MHHTFQTFRPVMSRYTTRRSKWAGTTRRD